MDGESRPWLCSCPGSRMSVRSELIMRLGSLREIILRGTLRGSMVLASVSLSRAELAWVSVCAVGAAYGVGRGHAGGSWHARGQRFEPAQLHPGQAHFFAHRTDEHSPLRGILRGKIRRRLAV